MSVNFFLNSEIEFMVSGDSDIASAIQDMETEKVLFTTQKWWKQKAHPQICHGLVRSFGGVKK